MKLALAVAHPYLLFFFHRRHQGEARLTLGLFPVWWSDALQADRPGSVARQSRMQPCACTGGGRGDEVRSVAEGQDDGVWVLQDSKAGLDRRPCGRSVGAFG